MIGSLRTVASEGTKYNSDLVLVEEIRWNKGGQSASRIINFSTGLEMHTKFCWKT
jgi:hypothetical protein